MLPIFSLEHGQFIGLSKASNIKLLKLGPKNIKFKLTAGFGENHFLSSFYSISNMQNILKLFIFNLFRSKILSLETRYNFRLSKQPF